MARKLIGIRRRREGWEAYVRVQLPAGSKPPSKLLSKQFAFDTPIKEMRDWRDDQTEKFSGAVPVSGSFGADIQTYLGRVSSMPTYKQRAATLELWAHALGRDRSRRSITATDVDQVLQEWSLTLAPGSVRVRRTALLSMFAKLDATPADPKGRLLPVRGSTNPRPTKAEARGFDYATIERILELMPEVRLNAPRRLWVLGARPLSLGRVRARVIAYTGIPPGQLQRITPGDVRLMPYDDFPYGSVRVHARLKGGGVEARTLPLTAEGRAAFEAFHVARAYGKFSVGGVNHGFKAAAKQAGLDPKTLRQYDLRHSFGMEMYRVTRDLATVGRLLGHTPGSPNTARYAQGANQAVDVAAVAAFSKALAQQRTIAAQTKAAPTRAKLAGKVGRDAKRRAS